MASQQDINRYQDALSRPLPPSSYLDPDSVRESAESLQKQLFKHQALTTILEPISSAFALKGAIGSEAGIKGLRTKVRKGTAKLGKRIFQNMKKGIKKKRASAAEEGAEAEGGEEFDAAAEAEQELAAVAEDARGGVGKVVRGIFGRGVNRGRNVFQGAFDDARAQGGNAIDEAFQGARGAAGDVEAGVRGAAGDAEGGYGDIIANIGGPDGEGLMGQFDEDGGPTLSKLWNTFRGVFKPTGSRAVEPSNFSLNDEPASFQGMYDDINLHRENFARNLPDPVAEGGGAPAEAGGAGGGGAPAEAGGAGGEVVQEAGAGAEEAAAKVGDEGPPLVAPDEEVLDEAPPLVAANEEVGENAGIETAIGIGEAADADLVVADVADAGLDATPLAGLSIAGDVATIGIGIGVAVLGEFLERPHAPAIEHVNHVVSLASQFGAS